MVAHRLASGGVHADGRNWRMGELTWDLPRRVGAWRYVRAVTDGEGLNAAPNSAMVASGIRKQPAGDHDAPGND